MSSLFNPTIHLAQIQAIGPILSQTYQTFQIYYVFGLASNRTTEARSNIESAGSLKRKAEDEPMTPSKYMRTPHVKVLVGPQRTLFNLPHGLLIRESPFFAAKMKTGWRAKTTDVELADITVAGFEVVLDWMIEKKLRASLARFMYLEDNLSSQQLTDQAYRAADFLMMPLLQNELLDNLVDKIMLKNGVWGYDKLLDLCRLDLCNGPYYHFVVDSAVYGTMVWTKWPTPLSEQLDCLLEYPETLKHVIETVARWARAPWKVIDKSSISKYHMSVTGKQSSV